MSSNSEVLNFVDSVSVGRLSRVAVARIEARSFSAVRLSSDPESLRQFDQVFANDQDLRSLVRSIDFDVVLPAVSDKRLRKYQSTAEARANSTAFSEAVLQLFTRLSSWKRTQPAGAGGGGVRLTLTATSPSDDPDVCTDRDVIPLEGRNAFKYISVDDAIINPAGPQKSLPDVPCVTSLDWARFDERTGHPSGRLLHPKAVSALVAALPSLEASTWHIRMPPRRLAPLRTEIRGALADALGRLHRSSPALRSLVIHLEDRQPFNERAQPERYVEPGEAEDPLGAGVRRLCCELPNLARLELRGSWILSDAAFAGARLGPALEQLLVDLAATTPDGRWHLDEMDAEDQGPDPPLDEGAEDPAYYDYYGIEREPSELPDVDSEDSDQSDPELPERAVDRANLDEPCVQVRGLPGRDTLVRLLRAFAEAVDAAAGPSSSSSSASLRSAEIHLSAELLLAQPNLGFLAAGQVEKGGRAFLAWPRPERLVRGEALARPNWYWAAQGPYGNWEIPEEVREFMRGEVHDNR